MHNKKNIFKKIIIAFAMILSVATCFVGGYYLNGSLSDGGEGRKVNALTMDSGFSTNQYVVAGGKAYRYAKQSSNMSTYSSLDDPITFDGQGTLELIFMDDSITQYSTDDSSANIASILQATKNDNNVCITITDLYNISTLTSSADASYTLGSLALDSNNKVAYDNQTFAVNPSSSIVLTDTETTSGAKSAVLEIKKGNVSWTSDKKYETSRDSRAFYQEGGVFNLNANIDGFGSGDIQGSFLYITGGTFNFVSGVIGKEQTAKSGQVATQASYSNGGASLIYADYNNSGDATTANPININLSGGTICYNSVNNIVYIADEDSKSVNLNLVGTNIEYNNFSTSTATTATANASEISLNGAIINAGKNSSVVISGSNISNNEGSGRGTVVYAGDNSSVLLNSGDISENKKLSNIIIAGVCSKDKNNEYQSTLSTGCNLDITGGAILSNECSGDIIYITKPIAQTVQDSDPLSNIKNLVISQNTCAKVISYNTFHSDPTACVLDTIEITYNTIENEIIYGRGLRGATALFRMNNLTIKNNQVGADSIISSLNGSVETTGEQVFENNGSIKYVISSCNVILSVGKITDDSTIYLNNDQYIIVKEPLLQSISVVKSGLTSYDDTEGESNEVSSYIAYFAKQYDSEGNLDEAKNNEYKNSIESMVVKSFKEYHQGKWIESEGGKGYFYVTEYKEYTVKFNGNGGSDGASITKKYGQALGTLPKSERTGYTFGGWYTSKTGGAKITEASTMPAGGATYYAFWGVHYYNVVFDKNADGATGTMDAQTLPYDVSAQLTKNAFEYNGYTFVGWISGAVGGQCGAEALISEEDATTNIKDPITIKSSTIIGDGWYVKNLVAEGDVTLSAVWQANKIVITLNHNNGTSANNQVYYTFDTEKYFTDSALTNEISTIAKPQRTGYTFGGYYLCTLNDNGSVKSFDTKYILEDGAISTTKAEDSDGKVVQSMLYNQVYQNSTLFAFWTANKYEVKFDKNAESAFGEMENQEYIYDLEQALAVNNFVYNGYSFLGWSKTSSATEPEYTNCETVKNLAPSGEITLYAVWSADAITITLDNQGATSGGQVYVYYKFDTNAYYSDSALTQSITQITKPTKNGYIFGGYYTDKNGVGARYITDGGAITNNLSSSIYKDNTLYAKWTAKTIKISLANNNATTKGTLLFYYTFDTEKYYADSALTNKISTITVPQRNGYTFKGYYSCTLGENNAIKSYNIKYVLEDGTISIENKSDDGQLVQSRLYNSIYDDAVLYAYWEANSITISLDKQGGAGGPDYVYYAFGTPTYYSQSNFAEINIITSIENPTRNGYTFGGYYSGENGTGYKYIDGSTGAIASSLATGIYKNNSSLYAYWVANEYEVTFDANGGTCGTTKKAVTFDKTYGELPTPTRDGYSFTGWFTAQTDGTKVTASTKVATASAHTLYAIWQIKTYTITFKVNNDNYGTLSVSSVENVPHFATIVTNGASVTLKNGDADIKTISATATAKSGYTTTFSNWTVDGGFVPATVTKAITITANFTRTPNNYTVTLNANKPSGAPETPVQTISEIKVTYDADTNLTSDKTYKPTLTGYTFAGYQTSDGKTIIDGNGKVVDCDNYIKSGKWVYVGSITATAQWTINKYNVVLIKTTGIKSVSVNGYTGTTNQDTTTYSIAYNTPITISATLADGYNFKNWTGYATATTASYSFTTPAQNVELTAYTTIKTYSITLSANNASYGTFKVASVANSTYGTVGKTTISNIPHFAKVSTSGSTLTISSSDGNTTYATATATITNLTGYTTTFANFTGVPTQISSATTITANFARSANTYTITFNANKPSGAPESVTSLPGPITVTYASSNNLTTSYKPTLTGYDFVGFFTENETKIFDSNGNVVSNASSVSGGTTTKYTNNGAWAYADNITLYAHWSIQSYSLTLTKGDGISLVYINGSEITSGKVSIKYNATVKIKATTSTGYNWSGWTVTAGGVTLSKVEGDNQSEYSFVMPAQEVKLTAKATIKTYSITLSTNNASYGTFKVASVKESTYGTVGATTLTNIPHFAYVVVEGSTIKVASNSTISASTTIYATATATIINLTGYTTTFANFTGVPTQISGATTITANFTRAINLYTITLSVNEDTPYGTFKVASVANSTYGTVGATTLTNIPHFAQVSKNGNTLTISSSDGNTTYATATAEVTNLTGNTTKFTGFSATVGGSSVAVPTQISSNATIIANFSRAINTYNIKLTKGTGISGVSATNGSSALTGTTSGNTTTYVATYGTKVVISATVSTGYTWNQWTGSTGAIKGSYYEQTYTISAMPAGDVELTAVATAITYTITYAGNGGTVSGGTTTYKITDAITLATVTRDGYGFISWKVTTAGGNWASGATFTSSQKLSAGAYGNVTLTAQWSQSFLLKDWKTALTTKNANYKASNIYSILFTYNMPTGSGYTTVSVGATDKTGETAYVSGTSEVTDVTAYIQESSSTLGKYDVIFYSPVPIYAPEDCSSMFNWDNCSSLASIIFDNFNTSNVINMSSMFGTVNSAGQSIKCTNLDLSNFNTSKVTDMSNMFGWCMGLISLNISGFDTSSVTNMNDMFFYCSKLTSLDVSNFDTSNVTDMGGMFSYCRSLTSLDVSKFDTSNVTYMGSMFSGCSSLTSLDVSNFDTSNVTDMNRMFNNCRFTSLDLSNFDTSNVTYMGSMFSGCSSLTSLDVSNFDTSNVVTLGYTRGGGMFYNCSSLTSLDLSNFDTSNVTTMYQMFSGCSSLTSLNLSNFDTAKVTGSSDYSGMYYMFYNCTSLKTLNISNFTISSSANVSSMLDGCAALEVLNAPKSIASGKSINLPKTMYYYVENHPLGCTTTLTSAEQGKTLYSNRDLFFVIRYENIKNPNNICAYNANGDEIEICDEEISQNKYTYWFEQAYMAGTDLTLYSIYRDYATSAGFRVVSFENSTGDCWTVDDILDNGAHLGTGFSGNVVLSYQYTWDDYRVYFELDQEAECRGHYLTDEYPELTKDIYVTYNGSLANAYYIENGEKISLDWEELPTVDGLVGWYKRSNYKNALKLTTQFTADAFDFDEYTADAFTIFAKWQPITMVFFGKTPNDYGENSHDQTQFGTYFTFPDASEVSDIDNRTDGFTFEGWYLDGENFTGTAYLAGEEYLIEFTTTPIKFYAKWSGGDAVLKHYWLDDLASDRLYDCEKADYTSAGIDRSEISSITFTHTKPDTYDYIWYGAGQAEIDDETPWKEVSISSYANLVAYITYDGDYYDIVFYAPGTIYAPESCYEIFMSLTECTSIDFDNFDTSYVTTMEYMFDSCSSLTSLDLSNFDTSKVESMCGMFGGCEMNTAMSLERITFGSNFITSNVTNMESMFIFCSSLEELDLSGFDTSKVTDMYGMFSGCSSLTSLDVTNFNTSNVTRMSSMFNDCSSLTSLDVSKFNTSNVTNMYGMFSSCSSLKTLNISGFTINSGCSTGNMFSGGCNALTTLNAPKSIDSSKSINLPKAMYYDNNGTATGITTLTSTHQGKTLYSSTITVTFNANGGTCSTANKSVVYNGTYGTLPTPSVYSKTGYTVTFKGWFTSATGGTQVTSSTKVTNASNHTLYAQYTEKANSYTVSFNANGGNGTMSSITVTYNTAFTCPACSFTRSGFEFSSWNESADGKGSSWSGYVGKAWTWIYDKDITLYAQWKRTSYSIVYKPNGGNFTEFSQTVTPGGACTIVKSTDSRIVRTGYTFAGWTTKSDGTDDSYGWTNWSGTWNYSDGAFGIADGKLVLYARWQAITKTISYNCYAGYNSWGTYLYVNGTMYYGSGSFTWTYGSTTVVAYGKHITGFWTDDANDYYGLFKITVGGNSVIKNTNDDYSEDYKDFNYTIPSDWLLSASKIILQPGDSSAGMSTYATQTEYKVTFDAIVRAAGNRILFSQRWIIVESGTTVSSASGATIKFSDGQSCTCSATGTYSFSSWSISAGTKITADTSVAAYTITTVTNLLEEDSRPVTSFALCAVAQGDDGSVTSASKVWYDDKFRKLQENIETTVDFDGVNFDA